MEKINDIMNSEVTMSEENDSLENSVKADSEESEIFETVCSRNMCPIPPPHTKLTNTDILQEWKDE